MQAKLIRLIWHLATFKAQKTNKIIPLPSNYLVYESFSDFRNSGLSDSLYQAYQRVFKESDAWQEDHSFEGINENLASQLLAPAKLVLMVDAHDEVTGFCWGQLMTAEQIIHDCQKSISFSSFSEQEWYNLSQQLEKSIPNQKILFVHEIGILAEHRRGLQPIQFLTRPILELGCNHNVKPLLWWTSKKSETYNLSRLSGLEILFSANDRVFLYASDFNYILKAARYLDYKKVRNLLRRSNQFRYYRWLRQHE